jgi:hypothetical protein
MIFLEIYSSGGCLRNNYFHSFLISCLKIVDYITHFVKTVICGPNWKLSRTGLWEILEFLEKIVLRLLSSHFMRTPKVEF